ncbi:hypothetical protein [Fontivita pretiosa]
MRRLQLWAMLVLMGLVMIGCRVEGEIDPDAAFTNTSLIGH